MSGLLRVGGVLLGVAATVFFVAFAYRTATLHNLQPLWRGPVVSAIAMASIAYATIIPISGWSWGRLLRGTGVRFPTLQLSMIIGISQMAKYVPGSVGQYLGRTAMSLQRGIPARSLFVTLVLEVLLTVAAAIVVGLTGLVVASREVSILPLDHRHTVVAAIVGLVISVLGLLVAAHSQWWFPGWLAPHLTVIKSTVTSSSRALSAAFAAYVLNYIVVGLGLYVLASAVVGLPPGPAPLFIGIFALSWVVGFVVPGAPAGLGVREGVMAGLLAPSLESARALEIILAFRVATTAGDLLGLAWGSALYLFERRTKSTRAPAASPGADDSSRA